MTPYELGLVAIAKNRGDSVTRQLAEILQKQDAQIEELETGLKNVWKVVEGKQTKIEALKDFAIWMTGCGYDFCQHEYFIKCRDELLIGKAQEK